MNDDTDRETAHGARAIRLRKIMYSTPGLLERLEAGREAAERGECVTLHEIDIRLAARQSST